MIFKRIQTVLALLLVGSVSMLADGGDPFPDVDYHQWQNTMTITGKVRLNGVELKDEAIVTAYYHDEIRGKQQVKANGYLYLSIGGSHHEHERRGVGHHVPALQRRRARGCDGLCR